MPRKGFGEFGSAVYESRYIVFEKLWLYAETGVNRNRDLFCPLIKMAPYWHVLIKSTVYGHNMCFFLLPKHNLSIVTVVVNKQ